MRSGKIGLIPAVLATALLAVPAGAVDLDTVALVSIVDGINIVETAPMNFGEVALNDGTVTIGSDGVLTDPSFLSFDATSVSQAIFTVTAIAGATYSISLAENIPVPGLTLNNFHINIDGGVEESGADNFVGLVLSNQSSTLNVGGDLTVDSATASLGPNQAIGYRLSIIFF